MTLWYLIPIIYLVIGIPFGIHESRVYLKELLKNESRYWYSGKGEPRRTEEERIKFVAGLTFWPAIAAVFLWPVYIVVQTIPLVWDSICLTIASPEIKAARKRAEDAKTQAILDSIRKEEEDRFKDL